jgi:hypothetical protein
MELAFKIAIGYILLTFGYRLEFLGRDAFMLDIIARD